MGNAPLRPTRWATYGVTAILMAALCMGLAGLAYTSATDYETTGWPSQATFLLAAGLVLLALPLASLALLCGIREARTGGSSCLAASLVTAAAVVFALLVAACVAVGLVALLIGIVVEVFHLG